MKNIKIVALLGALLTAGTFQLKAITLGDLIEKEDIEGMRIMLEKGRVNINETNMGIYSPLGEACADHEDAIALTMAKLLVKHGAKVNYPSCNPPLCQTCFEEKPKTVKFLLEHGATINNIKPQNPLTRTCYYKHLKTARVLIKHGATINTPNDDGITALSRIKATWSLEEITELLQSLLPFKKNIDENDATIFLKEFVLKEHAEKLKNNATPLPLALPEKSQHFTRSVPHARTLIKMSEAILQILFNPQQPNFIMPQDRWSNKKNKIFLKIMRKTPFDIELKSRYHTSREEYNKLYVLLNFAKAAHQKHSQKNNLNEEEQDFKKRYEKFNDIAIRFEEK